MGITRATLFLSEGTPRVYLTVLLQPYQAGCLDPLLPVAVATKMEGQSQGSAVWESRVTVWAGWLLPTLAVASAVFLQAAPVFLHLQIYYFHLLRPPPVSASVSACLHAAQGSLCPVRFPELGSRNGCPRARKHCAGIVTHTRTTETLCPNEVTGTDRSRG